jgi:hypothetical protein
MPKPLNPQYQIRALDDGHIIGVVRFQSKTYR